jgi:hypothetical protein
MNLYSLKMENYSKILIALVAICFLPQIYRLTTCLTMYIAKLLNKLLRLIIDLLGIFFCLIFFCPTVLLLIIFCAVNLLF